MSETRINTTFAYDPSRQGYDTNLWKPLIGAPTIMGNRLSVRNAAMVHYADVVKGDFNFNLNIPDAPGGDDGRIIGLYQPASLAFAVFTIGSIFSGDVANIDGQTQTTGSIPWNTLWQGNNINFRIRWEAGTVKFFVANTQVGCITDVAVPSGPLSLYLADFSANGMTIGAINATGVQSYVLNAKSADSNVYMDNILVAQAVTVTENVNIVIPTLKPLIVENITVSENFGKAIV